jgi:hypothetical protein
LAPFIFALGLLKCDERDNRLCVLSSSLSIQAAVSKLLRVLIIMDIDPPGSLAFMMLGKPQNHYRGMIQIEEGKTPAMPGRILSGEDVSLEDRLYFRKVELALLKMQLD